MKKLIILFFTIVLAAPLFAQMKQREVDAIKNDTTQFFGISNVCNSSDEAADGAKAELYENIAKNCKSSAIYIPGNGDKQLENIVMTFKERIDEKATEKAVIEDDGNEKYQYLVWLKRSDFRAMCDERRNDIQRYISKGMKMEDEACFEDALKSYYWALMLTYAHPQGKKLQFHGDSGTVDYEWIVERISGSEGILKSFNFIVPKENGIQDLEMDCSELNYMASSGLRVIQKTMRTVMQLKGQFKMTNVNPEIYKVLAMTGFTKFMKVEKKKEEQA